MQVYIGTALTNAQEHNELRDHLANAGISLTFDWTQVGNVKGQHEKLKASAIVEVNAIRTADAVVILLTKDRQRGTHCELGAALALRVPVILVSDDEKAQLESAFYCHPGIWVGLERCATWMDDVKDVLLSIRRNL